VTDILIIPDAHAHPDYDNDRFSLIGKAVARHRPEVVVCLGDFADMPSLSSYDRGKASFEGKRYWKDIECTKDAYLKMMAPIRELQDSLRAAHRPRYSPQLTMLTGNHEYRINMAADSNPQLHGTIGVHDLPWYGQGEGWEVVPFKQFKEIAGVNFIHYVPTRMGTAMSSKHLAHAVCTEKAVSVVVGHSHILDYYERSRPDGSRFFGLSAGCFGHPDHDEGWSRGTDDIWWRGLVLLKGVENGYWQQKVYLTMRSLEEDYK
jgi:predicted phosphodiesterase